MLKAKKHGCFGGYFGNKVLQSAALLHVNAGRSLNPSLTESCEVDIHGRSLVPYMSESHVLCAGLVDSGLALCLVMAL